MEKKTYEVKRIEEAYEQVKEKDLYNDLLIRLVIDSADAIKDYNNANDTLKRILNAFADGINYFLHKNQKIKPILLNHFEPWYPLLWTDGSIGAISTGGISVEELKTELADSIMVVQQVLVLFVRVRILVGQQK